MSIQIKSSCSGVQVGDGEVDGVIDLSRLNASWAGGRITKYDERRRLYSASYSASAASCFRRREFLRAHRITDTGLHIGAMSINVLPSSRQGAATKSGIERPYAEDTQRNCRAVAILLCIGID